MLDLNLEANTVYLSRPLEAGYKSPNSAEPDYKEQQETTIVRPSEQRELAPESGNYQKNNVILAKITKYKYLRLVQCVNIKKWTWWKISL